MADAVAIGPGAESVGVLLWAASPSGARWQRSTWGGGTWSAPSWRTVGCDVEEAVMKWGSSQESGILSIAEASEIDLTTLDPGRELDPINTASPYYGAVKPGTPVRVVGYAPGEIIAGTGFVDEVSFDLASSRGRIRAIGAIAYLAQAQLPASTVLPNTLRARVRAIVAAVGLGGVVPVEPELPTTGNALVNGGFEVGTAGAIPPGWRVNAGTGTATAGGVAHAGVLALNLRPASADFQVAGDAVAGQRVVGGATYTLEAWRWREGWANGSVTLYLHLYRADGSYIGNTVGGAGRLDWPVGLDADLWISRTATVAVPADCATVAVGIGATQGSEWIDDMTLTGPIADSGVTVDPPVAPHDGQSKPAWQAIADAGLDALTYIWADPAGVLRFRSWGAFADAAIAIGCKPADADPLDQWLAGLSTIETTAAGDAVRNTVRAYSSGTTWQPAATDPTSIAVYGPRPFDVERVVPDFATWSSRILADRADAGLDVAVGELRPYTVAELRALLETQLAGPAIIRVRDDAHGELVDLDVGLIGARTGVTARGWRFGLATLISRVEWDAIEPEPPVPPEPPPGGWHLETRTYIATSDALLALTSGGAKYGAGASTSLPVGVWSGWTYRALLRFPSIPWTKVRAVRTATLKVRSTSQVRVGFGSSPKAEIRRITSDWSAGSSSSPSGGNAVVWPGPSTTSTGSVTSSLPTAQNTDRSIRVDAIVRAWAPAAAGGSGAAQLGIRLGEASSSQSNTGEVWPVEQGGAARPSLVLELEIYD